MSSLVYVGDCGVSVDVGDILRSRQGYWARVMSKKDAHTLVVSAIGLLPEGHTVYRVYCGSVVRFFGWMVFTLIGVYIKWKVARPIE